MATWTDLEAKRKECGGSDPRPGINWTWTDQAVAFVRWLNEHEVDFEHRGVYEPSASNPHWSVRYR